MCVFRVSIKERNQSNTSPPVQKRFSSDVGKVEVSSPSSLKVMRFCLDDDEDWKKRDRRRETTLTKEEKRISLSSTKARKKKRRTNAFFLSNSRSLAKEKITTGGALVGVCLRAKVSKL